MTTITGAASMEAQLQTCFGASSFDQSALEQIATRDLEYAQCLNNTGLVAYQVVGTLADPQLITTSVCEGVPENPPAACCDAVFLARRCELTQNNNLDQVCKKLLDEVIFDTYECDSVASEYIPLGIFLGVLYAIVILGILLFRHKSFGGLLNKNFILWKQSMISSFFAQVFELALVGILTGILLGFTGMLTTKYYVQMLGIDFVLETPDSNRLLIYQNLRPFGGLFMLIVFTFPISSMTVSLVSEKDSRMREAMRMAGVYDTSLTVSWIITFLLTYVPLVLGAALLTHYGAIFPNNSVTDISFFFFGFLFAMAGMSYLVAVFFSKTRPAAVASICLAYLLFFSSFHFLGLTDLAEQEKGCLLAPVCLALGVNTMLDDASLGEGFARAATIVATDRTNLLLQVSTCTKWFIFDGFLYLVCAWYLDKVVPQRYGVRRRVDFVIQPLYPYVKKLIQFIKDKSEKDANKTAEVTAQEEEDEDLESVDSAPHVLNAIEVKDLTKVFSINGLSGGKRHALNNLNITFMKGQITCLLGPNGAGKSTFISTLTGLIEPTSGDISVFGKSVATEMHKIRGRLGWCPQYNCLYPTLTVRQHLELFSALRNTRLNMPEMKEMLKEMNILDKLNFKSKALSGGQKRKLSIALALIGDTDIVVIDEGSSGQDAASRRHCWNVLQNNRKGRAIIVTTHFMDEADVLGDKIVIMANGSLCCEGTSLDLKRQYGNGYRLMVSSTDAAKSLNEGAIVSLVKSEVQGAIQVPSKSELAFQLPLSKVRSFPKVLRRLQHEQKASVNINVTSLEDVFLNVAEKYSDTDTSLATLENASPYIELQQHRRSRAFEALMGKRFHFAKRDWRACSLILLLPILFTCGLLIIPDIRLYGLIFPGPGVSAPAQSQCEANIPSGDYGWAVTNTAPVSYPEDRTFPVNTAGKTCCPKPDDDASVVVLEKYVECIQILPQCVQVASAESKQRSCYKETFSYCYAMPWLCKVDECCDPTNSKSPFYLCQAFVELDSANVFNLDQSNMNNYCNQRDYAIAQSYVNAFVRSLLILLGFIFPAGNIIAFAVLENEEERNTKFQQLVNGVSRFTYWIASYVFDQFVMFIPLLIFPVVVVAAPTTSLNFSQTATFQAALLVLAFVLNTVPLCYAMSFSYKQHARALVGVIVFQIVTGGALSTLAYVLEVVPLEVGPFTTSELVSEYIRFGLAVFPGFAFADGLLRLQTQPVNNCATWHSNDNLKVCTDLFTVDELGGNNGENIEWSEVDFRFSTRVDATGLSSVQGRYVHSYTDTIISCAYLLGMGIVFWIYVIIRDTDFSRTWLGCSCLRVDRVASKHARAARKNNNIPTAEAIVAGDFGDSPLASAVSLNFLRQEEAFNKTLERQESFTQDLINLGQKDVQLEEDRVRSQNDDMCQMLGLRKVYKKGNVAVDNVWLGVKPGECLGLLGTSGSGKTTTIEMLTGAIPPTAGSATIGGDSVVTQLSKARSHIGYCPQFEALFDLLTVTEHLRMYAKIRGLSDIKLAVEKSIMRMQLAKFRHVVSKDLSGGNKRKLSAAIAMLGCPEFVILDEPTSGVDPFAQRFMWNVIGDTVDRAGSSLMLITHSLPEAEACCARIALILDSKLRCLGTGHHLKSLYGSGYALDLNLKESSELFVKPSCVTGEFVDNSNLGDVCEALGMPHREESLLPTGTAASSSVAFALNTPSIGKVPWKEFCAWWSQQDRVERVTSLFEEKWGKNNVTLQDRHGSYLFFNVSNKSINVADMFELLEYQQHEYDIDSYSLSQTSLEEIFQKWVETVDEYENDDYY